jgi:hypothetical protein
LPPMLTTHIRRTFQRLKRKKVGINCWAANLKQLIIDYLSMAYKSTMFCS